MTKSAFIFCVGRELLEGLVLDRNANFMAGKLSDAGYRVRSIQVLDDHHEASMVEALKAALAREPAYLFTTGGMGPGHDDITRQAIAQAAGLELHQDPRATEMLEKSYRRLFARGSVKSPDLNEDRLGMANVPTGAECYENPLGTAPAVRVRVGKTTVFLLPGKPSELQHMFDLYVMPALEADGPGARKAKRVIQFPSQDESALTRVLADVTRRYPDILSKARVEGEGIRITLLGQHTDADELEGMLETAEADVRARLGLEVLRPDSDREAVSE